MVATARTVGGLEELDDAIKAAGGTATLVPLDLRDPTASPGWPPRLHERYGKLDILIGNAALGASSSPLDHFQPKEWDEVIAVNVTANWHLDPPHARAAAALRRRPRGVRHLRRRPPTHAPTAGSMPPARPRSRRSARTYADETVSTPIRVNLFDPGPTRTRMRAAVMPGEDPMTLPTPEEVAATIVPLCLPSFTETGKLYDFRCRQADCRSARRPERQHGASLGPARTVTGERCMKRLVSNAASRSLMIGRC